jgi:hypothetical protein
VSLPGISSSTMMSLRRAAIRRANRNAVQHALHILTLDVGAFLEITEVDQRPVSRVSAHQRHMSATVLGMAFEHQQRQSVMLESAFGDIAWIGPRKNRSKPNAAMFG